MSEKQGLDWREIGLKAGLEIHQQLKTSRKLFCSCPVTPVENDAENNFERQLRPTRSELGEVDIAAFFEWKKGRRYHYHAPSHISCLVEADEEPPHELNKEAVLISLGMAKAFNSIPIDEIHVMRKIVIDGSNTSGFQRTALVAMGGKLVIDGKEYGIQTICVEEDAARKQGEEGIKIHYNLDRLGVPLIEIATAPDIETPEEAEKLAFKIGQLLRLTGKVKRGIGTIRQDLNISIKDGVKTEIKGVQELAILSKVVEYEAIRQLRLLEIRDELKKRKLSPEDIKFEPIDVTETARKSKSKIIQRNLAKTSSKALVIKLPRMKGLLGKEVQPGRRFGTELADYARFWGDVKGLFHSDELPAYGIKEEIVNEIYSIIGADKEKDAFILIVDEEEKATKALQAVVERIREAFYGIPKETRMALPDGTTKFLRPQPGAARMYPETDIPLMKVTKKLLDEAEQYKPQDPEEKLKQYIETLRLSHDLAKQVLMDEKMDLFDELVNEFKDKLEPKLIASTLIIQLKALKREGVQTERITETHLRKIFSLLAENKIPKEALEELLKLVAEHPEEEPSRLAEEHGLTMLSEKEVERIIDEIINDNINVIREKGIKAMGLIMGRAMAKLRGKAPGSLVSQLVKKKLLEKTS